MVPPLVARKCGGASRRTACDSAPGPQPLAILPGRQLSLEHAYTRPGKYRVTVTVLDDDSGLATDSFLIIVRVWQIFLAPAR